MAKDRDWHPADDMEPEEVVAAMDRWEKPYRDLLRGICELIGYGRVVQLAEGWQKEKEKEEAR